MERYKTSFSDFCGSGEKLNKEGLNTIRQFQSDHLSSLSQANLDNPAELVLFLPSFIIC